MEQALTQYNFDDLPADGKGEEVYLRYLISLRGTAECWDRGKGWISWLQGQALNRLVNSIRSRTCKYGAYGRVRKRIGMTQTTAWYCRQIAARCTADEARTLGYVAMLRLLGVRKPVERTTPNGLLQQVETLRGRLDRTWLPDGQEQVSAEDCQLAARLTSLSRTMQRAMTRFERRRAIVLRVRHEDELGVCGLTSAPAMGAKKAPGAF
jgi:hypothetical protein